VPPAPYVPEELRHRVFRGSEVVRTGLLTPRQLRGASWRRVFSDVYVHREVPDSHALRARAAAGVLLPGAVVSGRSAGVLWGVELAGPADDVEVTLPPGSHPVRRPGLLVRRALLPDPWICTRRGVRLTTPEATAACLAAYLPVVEGVVTVDQMVRSRVVTLSRVEDVVGRWTGPGGRRARSVVGLADGRAESPQETRLRLLMKRAGLPDPVTQYSVYAAGRFVARLDFAWPNRCVAVEYDGLWHSEPGQFARDRRRINRLHAAGWRVVFATAGDLHRPEEMLTRIAGLLAG
jgi:hypothetical protein